MPKFHKGTQNVEQAQLQAVKSLIVAAKKVLLVTHKNPDSDSMGSAVAFYDLLWRMQKKVYLFNASTTIDTPLHTLPWIEKLQHTLPTSYDMVVSFDCGDFNRLGIPRVDVPFINIDHHISNERYGSINIVLPDYVSTTQMVHALFTALEWKISPQAAQALYMGLVSDSVRFGTDRVTREVFMCASDLIAKGANASKTHQALFESHSLASIRLVQKMLETLELHADGACAVIGADANMFEHTGARLSDVKEALSLVLSLGVVQVALALSQTHEGVVKGSLRSKTDAMDVNLIAATVGGGGHKRASGFESTRPMDELKDQMIQLITKEFTNATKK